MTNGESKKVGALGESIACRFLENKGFKILDRNFKFSYGELDIVCRKDKKLYFVEVKSVDISKNKNFKPEDHLTTKKIKKLEVLAEGYLSFKKISAKEPYCISAVLVELDSESKRAEIRFWDYL